MRKVGSCPNCMNQTRGQSIHECAKCRKIYCTRCGRGSKCPSCGHAPRKIVAAIG